MYMLSAMQQTEWWIFFPNTISTALSEKKDELCSVMIIMAKMMHTTEYEIKVRTVGNFGLPDKFSYHIQL